MVDENCGICISKDIIQLLFYAESVNKWWHQENQEKSREQYDLYCYVPWTKSDYFSQDLVISEDKKYC